MKKIILTLLTLILSGIVFYSCSDESNNGTIATIKEVNNAANKLLINSSTDSITELSFNLGASGINISSENVNFKTKKGFYFSGTYYDLKDFSFRIEENSITLLNNLKYSIELNENVIYFTTPEYHGILDENNIDFQRDINVFVLRLIMNELHIDSHKDSFANKIYTSGASCSFWNTYYCVGIGATQSAAIADMNYEIADSQASGELLGCVKLGRAEPVSLSGGLAWATAFCCR